MAPKIFNKQGMMTYRNTEKRKRETCQGGGVKEFEGGSTWDIFADLTPLMVPNLFFSGMLAAAVAVSGGEAGEASMERKASVDTRGVERVWPLRDSTLDIVNTGCWCSHGAAAVVYSMTLSLDEI